MNPPNEPERKTPFPGPNATRPQPYKFSPEEMRVLRECSVESFYQRCLPFGAVLGGLTYYGVQTGYLKKSKNLGAVPKIAAAVIVGYFLGKVSYQRKCAEKFMALPDSKVGKALRARKLGVSTPEMEDSLNAPFSIGPFSGVTDSYSDFPSSKKNDEYGSTPRPEGLDDSFRPSLDNPIILHEEEMPPEQKHTTTYEELRKKNREEYEQKRINAYREAYSRPPPSASSQPTSVNKDTEFIADYKPPTTGPKNKYGDVWE